MVLIGIADTALLYIVREKHVNDPEPIILKGALTILTFVMIIIKFPRHHQQHVAVWRIN